jgi:glycosyltransferase involved in cell wall biosynthesis
MGAGRMSKRPLVSVIIIFLNEKRFLCQAIDSVFAQSYDAWELLLVDDGSTDGSVAIARACMEQHPGRVRYLKHQGHQNRGMSASRNVGIRHAVGEYITFLDADDVWLPQKLAEQVALLESQPEAGMLYGLSQWWYSWTGLPEDEERDFMYELGVPANSLLRPPELLTHFFLTQKAAIPTPSNIMVRRELVEKVGGFEDAFQGIFTAYEDQAFYAKVSLVSPVLAADECWDRYRQHPDSTCATVTRNGQEAETRLFFLNWLAATLEKQELKDKEIQRGLRQEMWLSRYPTLRFLAARRQNLVNRVKATLLGIGRRTLPAPVRHWLWTRWYAQPYSPLPGRVRLGSLRRLTPFSREFGYDRGRPIDRYYIEKFLQAQQEDVHGHVLEIADNTYTCQFGGRRVAQSDVLHVSPDEPRATIIGDLIGLDHVPADTFDCVILTQTLQVIYDARAALQTVYRILKPGGVLLATFPGLSPISRYDMDRWGYYWGFTSLSAQRLFTEAFPESGVQIQAYGNVLAATAFLYGMATEELRQQELAYADPDYEIIIAVRARKPDTE